MTRWPRWAEGLRVKDDATIPDVRAALLARVLWGVVNGSAVEVRPGGVVSFDDAVAHVTANLGAAAAQRIVALPDVRASKSTAKRL